MKVMKFILSLLVIIGLQQKVYGGLDYRKYTPSMFGFLKNAPSTFVPKKVKYSSMIQIVQNDESDTIFLKDYLAIKTVDLFKSTQKTFANATYASKPLIRGVTAILSTVSVAMDILLG